MLRGWSHAIAAPIALGFTVALAVRCIGDGPRLASMLVYGLSLALMYGWSAAYHIVTWPRDRRRLMRQVDHANIYLVIAATSTAIGVNILGGWERTVVLAAIWVFAVCGMLATVLSARLLVRPPRRPLPGSRPDRLRDAAEPVGSPPPGGGRRLARRRPALRHWRRGLLGAPSRPVS